MSRGFCYDPYASSSSHGAANHNYSEDVLEDDYDPSAPQYCPTGGATYAEMATFGQVSFWLEAVVLPVVGGIGIVCNTVSIPILLSR
jgi:hypothetical protein